jgi:hypothetical protein
MSAVTAAFAESGHGGPIPKSRYCPSKVRQAASRCDICLAPTLPAPLISRIMILVS